MPIANVNGVNLYYETTGEGFPLVLSHEFAGTCQSWEPQVRFFSRRYRVITYNHRGFPPSDVPEAASSYSQDILVEDLYQLLRYLKIKEAYIGGCSMGGGVALNFGLAHPEMTRALILAATGAGTTGRETFEPKLKGMARQIETEGWAVVAERYAHEPNRVQLLRKDPRGWQEFVDELSAHSNPGSVHLIREVIIKRPPISALETQLKRCKIPALVMVGDEDDLSIDPSLIMKEHMPGAGLLVLPQSGHAINLEEPAIFNRALLDFLTAVEAGKWVVR
ncbi:MAG: alpha/beta fold hydrolase [Chloroflexi bacterium]|nr:alpha/beta fold hydrolase [Chloroflexota bacterium]